MSDKIDDGGPAFPQWAPPLVMTTAANLTPTKPGEILPLGDAGKFELIGTGMSLRDWFAGQALTGMLAGGFANGSQASAFAYMYADTMLAERAKRGKQT